MLHIHNNRTITVNHVKDFTKFILAKARHRQFGLFPREGISSPVAMLDFWLNPFVFSLHDELPLLSNFSATIQTYSMPYFWQIASLARPSLSWITQAGSESPKSTLLQHEGDTVHDTTWEYGREKR